VEVEKATKETMSNPNIITTVCRAGWGAVTDGIMAGKGVMLVNTGKGDDPEIILNTKKLVDYGFASVIDERPIKEVMQEAVNKSQNVSAFLDKSMQEYGTIEGPIYAGKRLARELK